MMRMMSPVSKTPPVALFASGLALVVLATGGVERGVVVKVKDDGSGVVHLRNHAQESMRIGMFIQVEGGVADSNARHREGNLITLINVHNHPDQRAHRRVLGGWRCEAALGEIVGPQANGGWSFKRLLIP